MELAVTQRIGIMTSMVSMDESENVAVNIDEGKNKWMTA